MDKAICDRQYVMILAVGVVVKDFFQEPCSEHLVFDGDVVVSVFSHFELAVVCVLSLEQSVMPFINNLLFPLDVFEHVLALGQTDVVRKYF